MNTSLNTGLNASLNTTLYENPNGAILLGLDTCGASGTVALARVIAGELTLLGATELAGSALSAGLMPAIFRLLEGSALGLAALAGVVVVAGPGSFTGIRTGLATAKGLCEARELPLIAVSRLAVLASEAGMPCAALDAYRGQLFLGMEARDGWREQLATAGDFSVTEASLRLPGAVAVCEESVAQLIETVVDGVVIERVPQPGAEQALQFALRRWMAGELDDVAALDGHYLRGADARLMAQQRAGA